MKYLHYHILGFLFLVLLSSCMVEEESVGSVDGQLVHKVFDATFEDSDMTTKTVLDETVGENGFRGLLWESGDEIGVARYGGYYQKFTNVLGELSAIGVFDGYIDQTSQYYAIYPYTDNQGHGTSVSVTVPTVQTYRANSFDRNMAPMVGKGNDGERLHFMNLCGVLAVQLTGSETIKSIVFQTKNGEKVSGICSVDPDYADYPVLDTSTATETYVTLDCGEGVQLSGEATPFHIVLPPGTYNGFTLYITTADGKFMEKTTDKTLTIKRSIVTKAASFVFENNITEVTNLSEHGHSNCYIVPAAGLYSFDANIIGNGEFGLIEGGGFHTNNPSISPVSVDLLWEDRSGLLQAYALDAATGKVKLMTSGKEGNALIAVKDADDTILWSWHIWMTDQPADQNYENDVLGSFVMLDRNIGAIRADRGTGDEWEESKGVLYQWGRKDPFVKDLYIKNDIAWETLTLIESVQNPTLMPFANSNSHNWMEPRNDEVWSSANKTIYDPCPVGYKVPDKTVWSGFVNEDGSYNVDGNFEYGWSVIINDSDLENVAWYPSNDFITYWASYEYGRYNNKIDLWYSTSTHSFHMDQNTISYDWFNTSHASGFSALPIRCMKDEDHVDVSTEVIMKRPQISDVGVNSVNVSAGYRYGNSTTVTERGFVYGTTSDLSGADTKTIQVESDGKDFSLALTELTSLTRYYVKAYVINENGTYESDIVRFITTSEDGIINLSAEGTANCYIVSEPGTYVFDGSVKGNSVEQVNGVTADIVWEVDAYRDSRQNNIYNVRLEDGIVKFDLLDAEPGNALIAVKDENGTIVWSWHIWIVDYDPSVEYHEYVPAAEAEPIKVMNRVLGASQTDPDYDNLDGTWELTAGMIYQWGRKDPLVYDLLTTTSQYRFSTIEEAVAQPLIFAQGEYWWVSPFDHTLWSSDSKAMYDPCPVGWIMPDVSVFNAMSCINTLNPYGMIYDVNGQNVWYGYSDYIHSQGTHYQNNNESFMWTTSMNGSNNAYSVHYYSGSFGQSSNYYTDAYSVRCMKDE